MELIKFEIGNPAACAPRHSNAIARRNIRIGGVLINLRRTAGCQHHRFCVAGFHRFFITVPYPRANNPSRARQANFVRNNQINRVAALQHANIRMVQRLAHQRGFYFSTGGVGGMKNTTVTMSTFTGQMVTFFAIRLNVGIKQHPLVD